MHLNIKNDEAHRLAKELARLTGESMTQAVIQALEARIEDERRRKIEERGDLKSQIEEIVARVSALPVLDDRPGDAILYDENGLPK